MVVLQKVTEVYKTRSKALLVVQYLLWVHVVPKKEKHVKIRTSEYAKLKFKKNGRKIALDFYHNCFHYVFLEINVDIDEVIDIPRVPGGRVSQSALPLQAFPFVQSVPSYKYMYNI